MTNSKETGADEAPKPLTKAEEKELRRLQRAWANGASEQLRKAPMVLPHCEWFGGCKSLPATRVVDGEGKSCGTFCHHHADIYIFKFGSQSSSVSPPNQE